MTNFRAADKTQEISAGTVEQKCPVQAAESPVTPSKEGSRGELPTGQNERLKIDFGNALGGNMDFRGLDLKLEYRSRSDDVAKNFLNPLLKRSVLYKRAVGFFSSTSFDLIGAGICGLIENGGAIQIITSPQLSTEDVSAIKSGFKRRGEVSVEELLRKLKSSRSMTRLDLLSNLIAAGRLQIKIAVLESADNFGMFHEKLGLMHDAEDNVIAFSGSMNESANAFVNNYEVIDVFKSWDA